MYKLAKKCLPFYKILKNDKPLGWNEECETTFSCLKEYLSSPSILTRPKVGETLFLHIVTSDEAMETMLIIERNGQQRPVYYTNKVLHGSEVRYQKD